MSQFFTIAFSLLLLIGILFSCLLLYTSLPIDDLIAYSLTQEEASVVNSHIKNFVVIVQGRHTFDNYFGTFPGANGFPNGIKIPMDPFKSNETAYVEPFHLEEIGRASCRERV